jgi:hypothetical protein
VSSAEKIIAAVASTLDAVEVQGGVTALAQALAVVGEFHPDLVRAGRHLGVRTDVEALDPEEVVAVPRLAVLEVEAPTADAAALGDDHAVSSSLGNLDLGGDGV